MADWWRGIGLVDDWMGFIGLLIRNLADILNTSLERGLGYKS